MADKTLTSLVFPGLPDRYVVPDYSVDIEQIKEDLSVIKTSEYTEARKSASGTDSYTIEPGAYVTSIGGNPSKVTNAKNARNNARIPIYQPALVTIGESAIYDMQVIVCALGSPSTVLAAKDYGNGDIINPATYGADGVAVAANFKRKDGGNITSADITSISGVFRIYYSGTSELVKNVYPTITTKMPLELGDLLQSTKALMDNENNYQNFYKTMRTPHFLDLRQCKKYSVASDLPVNAIFYDASYTYISTTTLTSGTEYDVPDTAAYARFTVTKSDGSDFGYAADTIKVTTIGNAKMLKSIDNLGRGTNIRMCYIVPGKIGQNGTGTSIQAPALVDTTGLLRLPPNYTNDGEPVPLVVYAHGSSDYRSKWQTQIREGVQAQEVITYLVNEGFAVFDSFGHSSAVTFSGSNAYPHTYGNMDCINCYVAGIRRIMDVYNVRTDGVYITGISSGGLAALNMAFGSTIPVIACGVFAPVTSVFTRWLGYSGQQRKEFAWAQGFVGDDSLLEGSNGEDDNTVSIPAYSAELMAYYRDNARKIIGYNPMWNGVVGTPLSTLIDWALTPSDSNTRLGGGDKDSTNWTSVYRICKTPLKIWVADDDVNISPPVTHNFVISCQNGNCICDERLVPNGQGGHYAYTTSETTERASGKTALGVDYTDIPIYWLELVAFFRSF